MQKSVNHISNQRFDLSVSSSAMHLPSLSMYAWWGQFGLYFFETFLHNQWLCREVTFQSPTLQNWLQDDDTTFSLFSGLNEYWDLAAKFSSGIFSSITVTSRFQFKNHLPAAGWPCCSNPFDFEFISVYYYYLLIFSGVYLKQNDAILYFQPPMLNYKCGCQTRFINRTIRQKIVAVLSTFAMWIFVKFYAISSRRSKAVW